MHLHIHSCLALTVFLLYIAAAYCRPMSYVTWDLFVLHSFHSILSLSLSLCSCIAQLLQHIVRVSVTLVRSLLLLDFCFLTQFQDSCDFLSPQLFIHRLSIISCNEYIIQLSYWAMYSGFPFTQNQWSGTSSVCSHNSRSLSPLPLSWL